jgi:tetratricopeptide (TPR) repeat protein
MTAAAAPASSSPWIRGPATDVLLGTGMLYLPFFVVSLFLGPRILFGPLSIVPLLIILFAYAHLGATLVRVYERPEGRRSYRLFAVWITLLIAATVLVGLWVPIVGSVMLTVYLTFVPWHFTGQNYGISLVFLRRRGIEVTPELKRHLWTTFFLSYVIWILALHSAQPGTVDYSPLRLQGGLYSFLPLGIPAVLLPYLLSVVGVLYAWSLSEVAARLIGRAKLREIAPTFLLMLSQALWFSAPVIGRYFFQPEQLGPLAGLWAPWNAGSTFLVVSLMHSLQYLWITDYYVRKESPGTTTGAFLGKSLLAGMAIFGIPFLLLLPEIGGGPSYEAGLFLMLNGALNIHHVMMDGVIWKLRHTRIASILIGTGEPAPALAAPPRRTWLRNAVWASGLVGLALVAAGELETQLRLKPALASDDATRIESSIRRLSWLGRDHSGARNQLGHLREQQGDAQAALREYERSLEISPKPQTWLRIGQLHERQGRFAEASLAYDRALALAPEDVDALVAAGRVSLKSGRTDRARQLLARAAELDPGHDGLRHILAAIQERTAAVPNL